MNFLDNWLLLGLCAALLFGLSAVLGKIVVGQKFFGLRPSFAGILFIIGSGIVLAAFFLSFPAVIPKNPFHIAAGIGVGILWGIGQVLVLIAVSRNANIAQLAPIYNINTLVAVILGIFLLSEIPNQTQTIKIIVGGILITIGAVLVSG